MSAEEMLIFAPNATREFAERICSELRISLSPLEEREFEDGEHKVRPLVNVRKRDVYVVQSLYGDESQSVSEKLCRLLFLLAVLRDGQPERLTAVIPYLCYSRKDRQTKPFDPVTSRYVAGLIESVGVDHVVTMDVHNLAAFQNAFHRATTDHLQAVHLMVEYFASQIHDAPCVVAAPDAGGIKRSMLFRQAFHRRTGRLPGNAFVEKLRSQGELRGSEVVGDVEGKIVIILDDLISSGRTLIRAAEAFASRGASAIYLAATHGLFHQKIGRAHV